MISAVIRLTMWVLLGWERHATSEPALRTRPRAYGDFATTKGMPTNLFVAHNFHPLIAFETVPENSFRFTKLMFSLHNPPLRRV